MFEFDVIEPPLLDTTDHGLQPRTFDGTDSQRCEMICGCEYEIVRERHVHLSLEVKRNLSGVFNFAYSVHQSRNHSVFIVEKIYI
jgi:hypothetical protein